MIKELREEKGYTQESLAGELQISLRHYVRIDNERTIPRPDIFALLIKLLEMNEKQIGQFIKNVLKNKGEL